MPTDAVNLDTLSMLKEAMEDEFAELVEVFLESSAELLDDMDKAFSAGDVDTFIRSVHSLKSSSGNLGCESLSEMAAELEAASKSSGQLPADKNVVGELRAAFAAAKQVLQTA